MSRQLSGWQWILGVLVVVAIGGYLAFNARHAPTSAPTVTTTAAPAANPLPATVPRYPVPAPPAEAVPSATDTAPAAPDTSDAGVMNALSALPGGGALRGLFAPGQLIARAVAVIDALPRQEMPNNLLPLRTPVGLFATSNGAGGKVIDAANYARYTPYMEIVRSIDSNALVDWYVRYYAQFQDAYRQLGYPQGYFNDRLVAVIDNLLAAPEPSQPIALTQPKVLYEYADPALQALPVGQKMLIRVGPANAAVIKSKLRAIRAALVAKAVTAHPATHAPAATETDG